MRRLALLLFCAVSSCADARRPLLGARAAVECAPFARAITSVQLYGPADSWWDEAAGRYSRSQKPVTGSLLILTRSRRLPDGHVAVVSAVLESRRILLTQANWLHGRIGIDQPAIDVSPGNDWTAVRLYWPPSSDIGRTVYPAYGFIAARPLLTHRQIVSAVGR